MDTSAGHSRDLARRLLALALVLSSLAACGLLIGVEKLGVDPTDASSALMPADVEAPDVDVPKMVMDDAAVDVNVADGGRLWRHVFLRSTMTNGMLGGVDAADTLCTTTAVDAGLGNGPWVAWLSTNTRDAKLRLPVDHEYRLPPNGLVVALHTSQLSSGAGLENPINRMENGQLASSTEPWVWTGTVKNGLLSGYRCSEWQNGNLGAIGTVGSFDQRTVDWTDNGPHNLVPALGCQYSARLYCFEK